MADAFPRPRWYRLTPDRAVLGLLAVEGLLLLSQWFEWFAFNRHKGWTLSICLATVAAAFLLMLLWFLAALVFRLRFQFSILSLLVLVVVVAIPCSWLAAARKQAEKQREAVEEIRNAFGQVSYDYEYDPSGWQIPGPPGRPEPAWLRGLLGDDLFASVTQVHVNLPEFGDAGLKHLDGLPELQVLDLCGTTVSDAGLEPLKGLTQLQVLDLMGTLVSDAGLKHLKGLIRLRVLNLRVADISDAGLRHLKGLTQLQELDLFGTKVSDAGLQYLKGLNELREVNLMDTGVTDAGASDLQRALPKTIIIRR